MYAPIKKFLLVFLSASAVASAVNAADSLVLVPIDMNDKLVALLNGQDEPVPAGKTRIIGNFTDPGFSIPSLDNITVRNASGAQIPLRIEESSLVDEFGSTVALWISFDIPSEELSKDKALTIEWGRDVKAENSKVGNIKVNPASSGAYRTFTWRKKNENTSFARIEVIADSNASFYFLWYLLPMCVIFTVLTIRKITISRKKQA